MTKRKVNLSEDSDNLDREPKKSRTKAKKSRKKQRDTAQTSDAEPDFQLEQGQEIVGIIAQPPLERAPPGQLSQPTLDFLAKLKDPKCNDRTWFKLHEAVYRAAEQEWKAFIESFTDVLVGVDRHIPHLPPSDVIHRIYRDIRFSNDKTPYKTGFSATFSRSGRKGIFAGYHLCIKSQESFIAAGTWQPGKNELASIRANIKRNPRRIRDVIENSEFTALFGPAERSQGGGRQNIFGQEDELKTAPKGIAKDHPEIDLLRCRSFVVVHRLTDEEVLDADFKTKLGDIARVMRPFVHCLNDLMSALEEDEDDE